MNIRRFSLHLTTMIILIMGESFGQEITAVMPQINHLNWGTQTIGVNIQNQADDYRLVVAKADVMFEDSLQDSDRHGRTVSIIEPLQKTSIQIPVEIPGNFGTVHLTLSIYNVVDTLDALLPSQKFASFEYQQEFPVPASLPGDLSDIKAPPYVLRWGDIDNDFDRALILMAERGKSPEMMATLAGVEKPIIDEQLRWLTSRSYLIMSHSSPVPIIAVIDSLQISQLVPLIDQTVEILFNQIALRLVKYDEYLASLASEKKIARDGNSILEPSSILYHKYPFIFGLLLWSRLGTEFINDGKPFNIFANEGMEKGKYFRSDPCRARMGKFNYLVASGEQFAGRSFYYFLHDDGAGGDMFYCGVDEIPIDCHAFLDSLSDIARSFDWTAFTSSHPIYFQYEDKVVDYIMAFFGDSVTKAADPLRKGIDASFASSANSLAVYGARYWAWNLMVTNLMKKLEDEKLLEREGEGFYHFQRLAGL